MSKVDNIYIRLNLDKEREKRVSDFLAGKNANKFIFLEAMEMYINGYEKFLAGETTTKEIPKVEVDTGNAGIDFLRGK